MIKAFILSTALIFSGFPLASAPPSLPGAALAEPTIASIRLTANLNETEQINLLHALNAAIDITVNPGGDIQGAMNAATCGDRIVLQVAGNYPQNIVLPNKGCTQDIVVTSSRASELPQGARVGPGQAPLMAHLQGTVAAEPIIKTTAGAGHYKFIGLEISTIFETTPVYDLVRFGDGRDKQTTLAQVPHDLSVDRCWIHGFTNQVNQRGVSLNCAECSVVNSYIDEIHHDGSDSQAIGAWNGPGPFHVINDTLIAAGENSMWGGADAASPELVPSSIEMRRNYLFKPLTWKVGDPAYLGKRWVVKNNLEFKNAKNGVIDGNIVENNWANQGQDGKAVLFTVRNQECTNPYATVQNISVSNMTVKNADGAFNFLGMDNEATLAYVTAHPDKCNLSAPGTQLGSVRGSNVSIQNVLAYNLNGAFLNINGFNNITVDRPTHLQNGNLITFSGEQSQGFRYTNGVTVDHQYGIFGDGGTVGVAALDKYAPGWVFAGSVVANPYSTVAQVQYPAGNDYPATLNLPADFRSPFPGKGADIDQLNAAQSGTVVSTPTPSPTATVSPSPSPIPTATPFPTPSPTPAPSPTPQPSPTLLTADWPWPSKYADQVKLREQVRQNGWVRCVPFNSRYWCEK